MAMAIWEKKPEVEGVAFSTTKMRIYCHVIEGNKADPGTLVLMVFPGAAEPKCFLVSRMNSATAIPNIELIHSMGRSYVVMLGRPHDLHGHMFAFVGKQVGDQLHLTFLEPTNEGGLMAFQIARVKLTPEVMVDTHLLPPSTNVCDAIAIMDVWMNPLMWYLASICHVRT